MFSVQCDTRRNNGNIGNFQVSLTLQIIYHLFYSVFGFLFVFPKTSGLFFFFILNGFGCFIFNFLNGRFTRLGKPLDSLAAAVIIFFRSSFGTSVFLRSILDQ